MTGPKPIRHRGLVLRWDGLRWTSRCDAEFVVSVRALDDGTWFALVTGGLCGGRATRSTAARAIDGALADAQRHVESELRTGLRIRNRLRKMRGAP